MSREVGQQVASASGGFSGLTADCCNCNWKLHMCAVHIGIFTWPGMRMPLTSINDITVCQTWMSRSSAESEPQCPLGCAGNNLVAAGVPGNTNANNGPPVCGNGLLYCPGNQQCYFPGQYNCVNGEALPSCLSWMICPCAKSGWQLRRPRRQFSLFMSNWLTLPDVPSC